MHVIALSAPNISTSHGGLHQITGTVNRLGVAYTKSLVVLMRTDSLKVIAVSRCNADGAYAFLGLKSDLPLMVLVRDTEPHPLNAAISDYVTPEPMDV